MHTLNSMNVSRIIAILLVATTLSLVCVISVSADNSSLDASKLLEQADSIRFPKTDFRVTARITTSISGTEEPTREYEVLSKGNNLTLIKSTAPPTSRGQVILMKEHDLWVYMPTVSQPVRIPVSQRLAGQVANGDLARVNFTGDYTPALFREDNIGDYSYHVLELTANGKHVTYNRVLLWIEKTTSRPYKAEFYASSGRLIKTCLYEKYVWLGDAVRPSQLIMTDALHKDQVSAIEFSNIEKLDLPDKMFTKEYLKKMH